MSDAVLVDANFMKRPAGRFCFSQDRQTTRAIFASASTAFFEGSSPRVSFPPALVDTVLDSMRLRRYNVASNFSGMVSDALEYRATF